MKLLIDRLDPKYKKLVDDVCTTHISYPGFQAVLKLLLAERVSIRNLHLIIEAVAGDRRRIGAPAPSRSWSNVRIPHGAADLRRPDRRQHAPMCCVWATAGTSAFHQALKRDSEGRDPRIRYRSPPARGIRRGSHQGHPQADREAGRRFFALVTGAKEARPPMCAWSFRAAVPDPARAEPRGRSRAASRSRCWEPSPEASVPTHGTKAMIGAMTVDTATPGDLPSPSAVSARAFMLMPGLPQRPGADAG